MDCSGSGDSHHTELVTCTATSLYSGAASWIIVHTCISLMAARWWHRMPKGFLANYVPTKNSRAKGTSLGCRLAPKMIPNAEKCAVWAAFFPVPRIITSKLLHFCCFWSVENPRWRYAEIFSPPYACRHQYTSVVSKMVKLGAGQVAKRPRYLGHRKNTFWRRLEGTPGTISPIILRECALWFLTYIPGFIQIRSGSGEL